MAGPYFNDPIFFESVSAVTATPSVELGRKRTDGANEYIYVYNTGDQMINPTYGAVLNSAVSNYSVSVSSVCQSSRYLGVVKHSTIPTGQYGWLLTRGFTQVEMGATESAAAGGPLAAAINGTFLGPVTGAVGLPNSPVGVAISAVASGASTGAWIYAY